VGNDKFVSLKKNLAYSTRTRNRERVWFQTGKYRDGGWEEGGEILGKAVSGKGPIGEDFVGQGTRVKQGAGRGESLGGGDTEG